MELTIAHLFPDLLNLYGDRGNIISLTRRLNGRKIASKVLEVTVNDEIDFSAVDIVFLGGGSDKEMEIVTTRLQKLKKQLTSYVEQNGVMVAICGGYQLLGHYYQLQNKRTEGLSILDIQTESKPNRLIGNVVIQSDVFGCCDTIVGFENHGGRTYIGSHRPLGKVLWGYGNNGEDGWEGVVYKNVIGTYLHGPLFPKNPRLCDYVLQNALEKKYGIKEPLPPLDDTIEQAAHAYIVEKYAGAQNGR